jgi:hypothetical protein
MSKFLMMVFIVVLSGCTATPEKSKKPTPIANLPEKLRYQVPKDFQITYQGQEEDRTVLEMIPKAERMNNWTRMITIQTFSDPKFYEPEQFIVAMAEMAKIQCRKIDVYKVRNNFQNGHLFSQKVITCEGKQETEAKETIQVKAIKGKENFYVVQVATKVDLSENEAYMWAVFLRDAVAGK